MIRKFSFVSIFLLVSSRAFAVAADPDYLFVTNQAADTILGHQEMIYSATDANDPKSYSLNNPIAVLRVGNKLFVGDWGNNRILVYNQIPTSNNAQADVVVGQPDFVSNTADQGQANPSANTLDSPRDMWSDGTKLIVADTGNNRVLIYNSIPTTNNASADVVIGQTDFKTPTCVNPPFAHRLCSPAAIHVADNKLLISDSNSHRVLIFNSIPTTNGVSADFVLGQPHMNTNTANYGGSVSSGSLNLPAGIWSQGSKLFVADNVNDRVLIWNNLTSITTNFVGADIVLGQQHLNVAVNYSASPTNATLRRPQGVMSDGSKIYIADASFHRVLIWNSLSSITTHFIGADIAIGQPHLSSVTANQGLNTPTTQTLSSPYGLSIGGGALYVADLSNDRILSYNLPISTHNASASLVVGQPDFVSEVSNQGGPNAASLDDPRGTYTDGTKLVVADTDNHRVLIWNSISSLTNGKAADVILGQLTSTTTTANIGGRSAATLSSPRGVYITGNKLFVADSSNNRVLVYDPVPTASFGNASFVIGQADFSSGSGANSLDRLNFPNAFFSDGNKLWVANYSSHTIVVYNPIPAAGVAVSTSIIGHGGTGTSATQLKNPSGVFGVGNRLFVADTNNHRVLIFTNTAGNTIPDGAVAVSTVVIGQIDLNSGTANAGLASPAAWTLNSPESVWSDGTKLWVVDDGNHRVLQFNAIPSVNASSATSVLGQTSLTSAISNAGANPLYGVSASSLNNPYGIFGSSSVGATKLFVTDNDNHRVLVFNGVNSFAAPSSLPANLTGTALGAGSMNWTWTALANAWHQVVASTGGAVSSVLAANTTFFIETNLSTNTAYSRAVAVSFGSAFANALTSTTTAVSRYTLATEVINATVTVVAASSATFNWNAVTNPADTRFVVEQSTSPLFNSVAISTPVAFSDALILTTTTISGLLPGATVAFRISSYNGDGVPSLGFSNVISTRTPTPANFTTEVNLTAISSMTASAPVAVDAKTAVVIGPSISLPNSSQGGMVAISTNPLQTPLAVSTSTLASANANIASGNYLVTASAREFAFYDQGGKNQTGNFGGNVILFMPYSDANQDGFVDSNTKIPESKLKIFRLNESLRKWEEVGGTVDTVANNVFVPLRSLSVYVLIAPLVAANLEDVRVYPTPWQIGATGPFDATNLTFDNLTDQAKVQIYTILGELVFEKEASGTDGKITWDGKNMKGENAASGVYLWRVTNNSGQSKQGRLAIER